MAGDAVNYDKLGAASRCRWPLIGRGRRTRAVERLAELGTAQAVPHLIAALADEEAEIASRARRALVGLSEQEAKDALCARWVERRDAGLAAIMAEGGHVAAEPPAVRVLSALKVEAPVKPETLESALLAALAAALEDADAEIAERADAALRGLGDRDTIDAICEDVIAEPDRPLREAAVRYRWRHSDAATDCLFLFFSDQTEEYFVSDIDCMYLAEVYDQSDERLRDRIREKVRATADRRLTRILHTGGRGRTGPEDRGTATTDLEIAAHIARRNENYRALFEMVERGSYRLIMQIMGDLTAAGWEPERERDRRFYQELLEHYRPLALLAQQADSQMGEEGLGGILADESLEGLSDDELREMSQSGAPSRRASALAALGAREAEGLRPLVEQALSEQHWNLRFAALRVAPAAGASVEIETIGECLNDRVALVSGAAMEMLLRTGLRGRTPEDIERIQRMLDELEERVEADESAKQEATRVLELMLCVLRRRITAPELVPEDRVKPTFGERDISIVDLDE